MASKRKKTSNGIKSKKAKAPTKSKKPKKPSITQLRLKEQEKEIKRIKRWMDKQASKGYQFNDKAKQIIEAKKRPTARTIEKLKAIKGSELRKTFYPHAQFITEDFSLIPADKHYKDERSKSAIKSAQTRKKKKELESTGNSIKTMDEHFKEKRKLEKDKVSYAKMGSVQKTFVTNILSGINEYTTSLPFMNTLYKRLQSVIALEGYKRAYELANGLNELLLSSDYMNPWEHRNALLVFLDSAVTIGLISQSERSSAVNQIEANYVEEWKARDERNRAKRNKLHGYA